MMKTFKMENNDLVIDARGNISMTGGPDEEAQAIEHALTTNAGEWFLNVLHGLAYEQIFVKPFDKDRARLAVIEAVSQEPRVESVEDVRFAFNRVNRCMEIAVTIKMQSGNTVEAVVPVG